MNRKPTCLAGASLLLLAGWANAATLLNDNFDSYANQAAFNTAWPTTVGTSGTLTSTNFTSSPNSVRYDLVAQRNDRTFTESGTPSALNAISFSFDFYDSNAAAAPYRQFSSLIDGVGTSSGQLISLGLNNNLTSAADGGNFYMARILGGDGGQGASAFFKLNLGGASTLRSTGWHKLGVTVSNVDFKFYVDGILSETVANSLTLRSYDSVRLSSGLTSANFAGFDNVLVTTNPVPEPSSIALCLLGGLVLAGAIRKDGRI